MRRWLRFTVGILATVTMLGLGLTPGMAQSRPHVYLFRGLGDVFSIGMDVLASEINERGVYATSHSYTDWKALAEKATADYKAKKEGPIILIGHSLGADAVIEMADYLGGKGIPVALVVPFDATQPLTVSQNVARVVNFTRYTYMRPAPGFRGSLNNVDLSSRHDIDHLNIDKSPELHGRVLNEVLAIVASHRIAAPDQTKPASPATPASSGIEGSATGAVGEGPAKITAPPAAPARPVNSGAAVVSQPANGSEPRNPAPPAVSPLPMSDLQAQIRD